MDIINRHPQPQLAEKEYSKVLIPTSQLLIHSTTNSMWYHWKLKIKLKIKIKTIKTNKATSIKVKNVIFKINKSSPITNWCSGY